jgi:hypothetical protein
MKPQGGWVGALTVAFFADFGNARKRVHENHVWLSLDHRLRRDLSSPLDTFCTNRVVQEASAKRPVFLTCQTFFSISTTRTVSSKWKPHDIYLLILMEAGGHAFHATLICAQMLARERPLTVFLHALEPLLLHALHTIKTNTQCQDVEGFVIHT